MHSASGTRSPVRLPNPIRSKPSRYLCVASIFRNEAPYLAEWLEFHLLVGIEHFYLYDNGSTDNPDAILDPYVEQGLVTVIPWATSTDLATPKVLAYAHVIANFGSVWHWMAFIDIDEFLLPVQGEDLRPLLKRYEDLPAVAIPWIMFGHSGHSRQPAGLVIENYTQRAPFPPPIAHKTLFKWKAIANPSEVAAVHGAHDFEYRDGYIGGGFDEQRVPLDQQSRYASDRTADILRVNHYATKSKDEFAARMSSSVILESESVTRARRQRFADGIEASTVYDDVILRFVPALRERLQALKESVSTSPRQE